MATISLLPAAIRLLDDQVDEIFDGLIARLLGHAFTGKNMYIAHDPKNSLPGIFAQAAENEGGRVDIHMLTGVASIARDYLIKNREEAKAKTKNIVNALLSDLSHGKINQDEFRNRVDSALIDLWGAVKSNVERVVLTENEHAATAGTKTGIEQMNDTLGIDDPVVFFIPIKDKDLCSECKRVHLLEDLVTPRVWLSSEVSANYHVKGENFPSWNLMHPHCRCALSTLIPGFGFDGNGRVSFIATGFDELKYQRESDANQGVDSRREWFQLNKSESSLK